MSSLDGVGRKSEIGSREWDFFAGNYQLIFSPFAQEMTVDDGTGVRRNILIDFLRSLLAGHDAQSCLADFGCGPGNLIPFLSGYKGVVFGVDLSHQALNIAAQKAQDVGVRFLAVHNKMEEYSAQKPFDVIVSVNSVLPHDRSSVREIFQSISRNLKPDGVFVSILPSYDTMIAMLSYHEEIMTPEAFRDFSERWELCNHELAVFDENHIRQCYHTPDSIRHDLSCSGLELSQDPQKIYYPWSLSEKFGYGFFPEKEEIWDWFVVAKPACVRDIALE
ncbi:MAG: class I SAM-dependent methyltransferase [Pseudobdellovibrionaceae bacterium]|jgi:SAM-dependent methyltransferase|nr:class I SAM-dependent methyltransferase [Pseudobdellovibrionaceae bacterium]